MLGVETLVEFLLHSGVELRLEDAVVAMGVQVDYIVGVEEAGEELETVGVVLIGE